MGQGVYSQQDEQLSDALAHMVRAQSIAQRWSKEAKSNRRWQIIRDAYSLYLPYILSGPCDPYILDWDFTPIEYLAWQDIRGLGLPLYPQFPALQYFIDFADPVLQIGIELDGKEFHDKARDLRRDEALWEQGWRIFRIPGREALPAPCDPFDHLDETELSNSDAIYRARAQWGDRWSEGFFWALGALYYGKFSPNPVELDAAYRVLHRHRYVQFPIELEHEIG